MRYIIFTFLTLALVACGSLKDDNQSSSAPSENATYIYTSSGKVVGKFVGMVSDQFMAITKENYLIIIDVNGYVSQMLYGNLDFPACYFESADCSGQCLVMNGIQRNTIFQGQGLFVRLGNEQIVSTTTNSGRFIGSSCSTGVGSAGQYFIPTNAWSPPTGVTFPISNWYFDSAQ